MTRCKPLMWFLLSLLAIIPLVSFAQTITVGSPVGGESWAVGSTHRIHWTASNVTGGLIIQLNRSFPGDAGWVTIGTATMPSDGFNWVVTGPTSHTARIKVSAANTTISGLSPSNFSITDSTVTPHLTLVAPNGGESWTVGTTQRITWTATGLTGSLTIQLNRAMTDTTWTTIGTVTLPADGFSWAVTAPGTEHARVRLIASNNVTATSAATFTIVSNDNASLLVVAPHGGEHWTIGTVQRITWQATGLTGGVAIRLNRNYGTDTTWTAIGSATLPSDGFSWTVTGPASEHCRVSVVAGGHTAISADNFTIVTAPTAISVTLVRPNGGETWEVGSRQEISWTTSGVQGSLVVQLNRNYPNGEWGTLATLTAEHNSFSWLVTAPASPNCRVRVRALSYNTDVSATSHENFAIVQRITGGGTPGSISLDMVRAALPSYGMLIAPNPFNPTTTISYRLPEDGWVKVSVFDVLGREIAQLANEAQTSGIHTVSFDGLKMPSGLYIVSVKTANQTTMKKMFLLK